MTPEALSTFAQAWIDAWNRRDVEVVLAHFADEIRFIGPRAHATVGTATVVGKAALRDYWQAALAGIGTLQFALDHTVWDPERQELVILYTASGDGGSASGASARGPGTRPLTRPVQKKRPPAGGPDDTQGDSKVR